MKLYATTTSERASKGQGGNEYIEIELKAGDRVHPIGYIELYLHNDEGIADTDEWVLTWRREVDSEERDIIAQGNITRESKGKKQEGVCKVCNVKVADNVEIHHHYIPKGKKQEGECGKVGHNTTGCTKDICIDDIPL